MTEPQKNVQENPEEREAVSTHSLSSYGMPAVLVLITAIVYAHTCRYGFLGAWDDDSYVTANTRLALSFDNVFYWFKNTCVSAYGPLTMLSLMVDHAIWGMDSLGYHIHNLVLHLLVVIGFFYALKQLRISEWGAFAVALFFAVHPQRLEAVAWVSERKEVLCAAFYVWAFYLYIRYRDGKWSWLALPLFVAALLAKPMAVSLPVVLLLYEIYRQRSWKLGKSFLRLVPYFASALVIALMAMAVQPRRPGEFDLSERLWSILHNYPWYVLKTFYPIDLAPLYPEVMPSLQVVQMFLAVLLIAAAICFWAWRAKQNLVFSVLPIPAAFVVVLLPVVGVFPLGAAIDYADRYSYLPALFLLFGVACIGQWLVSPWLKSRYGSDLLDKRLSADFLWSVIVLVGAVMMVPMTYLYSAAWETEYAAMTVASAQEPANSVALWNLAVIEIKRGNFRKLFELSQRLEANKKRKGNSGSVRAIFLKAFALRKLGQLPESTVLFEQLIPVVKGKEDMKYLYRVSLEGVALNSYHLNHSQLGEKRCAELLESGLLPKDSLKETFFAALLSFFKGNVEKSQELCRQILAKDSENELAWALLRRAAKKSELQ